MFFAVIVSFFWNNNDPIFSSFTSLPIQSIPRKEAPRWKSWKFILYWDNALYVRLYHYRNPSWAIGFRETTGNLGPFKYRIVRFYFKFLDINNGAFCIILHDIAKGNNKVSIAYFLWFTNLFFFKGE